MSLYMWNPIDEDLLQRLEQDKNGRKVMPIINLFRKLTNDDPYLYCPFELFPVAMIRALLKFMVTELGLDERTARKFYINHLAFASLRFTIDETIAFFGEENFDKIISEILELESQIKKEQ